MKRLYVIAACCAAVVNVSMAGWVPDMKPGPTAARFAVGPSPDIMREDSTHRFIDTAHTTIYFQNEGAANVGVVIPLFRLVALANNRQIASATESQAQELGDKLPIDAPAVFLDSAKAVPELKLDGTVGTDPLLSPYLVAVSADSENVRLAALLKADFRPVGNKYTRAYWYELPDGYPRAQLAALSPEQLSALQEALKSGFQQLAAIVAGDSKGAFIPSEKIKATSSFIVPGYTGTLDGFRFDAGPNRTGVAFGVTGYVFPIASFRGGQVFSLPAGEAQVEPR